MGRLKCFFHTLYSYIKYGEYIPHVFVGETKESAIVIAGDKNFRVSKTYDHVPGETVYPHAIVYRSRCKYCGKEEISWSRNDNIPII